MFFILPVWQCSNFGRLSTWHDDLWLCWRWRIGHCSVEAVMRNDWKFHKVSCFWMQMLRMLSFRVGFSAFDLTFALTLWLVWRPLLDPCVVEPKLSEPLLAVAHALIARKGGGNEMGTCWLVLIMVFPCVDMCRHEESGLCFMFVLNPLMLTAFAGLFVCFGVFSVLVWHFSFRCAHFSGWVVKSLSHPYLGVPTLFRSKFVNDPCIVVTFDNDSKLVPWTSCGYSLHTLEPTEVLQETKWKQSGNKLSSFNKLHKMNS